MKIRLRKARPEPAEGPILAVGATDAGGAVAAAPGVISGVRARLATFNYAKVFLLVALVWGVVLVFLVPPLQNFDELAHYYRAWSVAEGQIEVPANGTVIVPRSVAELPSDFPYAAIATRQVKTRFASIPGLLWQPIGSAKAPSSSFAAAYMPLAYLPQAGGVLVAMALGHSPLLSIYLGRLANLVVCVLLVFFALRLLPFGRLIMFVIALFPMTMLQMASLSADALLISGTFFFIALTLHYSQKTSLAWVQGIALAACAALLLNAKPGYAALSLLVFVIPPRLFGTRTRYLATMGATVLATVAFAALIMLSAPSSQQMNVRMLGPHNGLDAGTQVATIVHHPLAFAKVVETTFGAVGLLLAKNSVGNYAWGQLTISDTVAVIGWLALVAVFFIREPVTIRPWQRLVMIGTGLAVAATVITGMYVTWTPVGGATVLGIQGRYFYPAALAVLLGAFGFPFRRRWVVLAVVALALAALIYSSLNTLLVYYY